MILTSLLLFVQTPEPEDPHRVFAAGPKDAYYMEAPESVSRPFVRRIEWLASGSSLLIERLVPPEGTSPLEIAHARQSDGLSGMMRLRPRVQVIAWSLGSHVSRTLLDLDSARAQVESIEPLNGSDQALLAMVETPLQPDGTVSPPIYSYSLLSGSTGNVRRIWAGSSPVQFELAASRPVGAVYLTEPSGLRRIALFGVDGKLGNPVKLPTKSIFHLTPTGVPVVAVVVTDSKGKRTWSDRILDMQTGTLGAEDKSEEPKEPIKIFRPIATSGHGQNGVLLAVLAGQKGDAPNNDAGIVTTDGSMAELSPSNNAIAYVSGHSAFVRTIVKVKRSDFDAAVIAAGKQVAMKTAKQVGLAMSMYAADFDGAFPPSGGDGKNVVNPYLRNNNMLDGFSYTFGGGLVTGNPGSTELGSVAGPGGRAVVYADGSVKWLPDGP